MQNPFQRKQHMSDFRSETAVAWRRSASTQVQCLRKGYVHACLLPGRLSDSNIQGTLQALTTHACADFLLLLLWPGAHRHGDVCGQGPCVDKVRPGPSRSQAGGQAQITLRMVRPTVLTP